MNLNNFIPNIIQSVSVIGTYSKADLPNNKAHTHWHYSGLLVAMVMTFSDICMIGYLECLPGTILSGKVVERYTIIFLSPFFFLPESLYPMSNMVLKGIIKVNIYCRYATYKGRAMIT